VNRPVVVVWIGGMAHEGVDPSYGGIEFNLRNDITAANIVFDSRIELWQVPANVYSAVSVSYTELEEKIGGTSKLADYLIRQLVEWNATWHPEPIESRSLGDSPAVSLILNPRGGSFRTIPAPRFDQEGKYVSGSGHPVRVCESVDVRFLLEDMFAKIRKHGRELA
jgi:purine nucleosidase